jgi:hypothetical protein
MHVAWGASWAWGLSLIALNLGLHAVGLVVTGVILARLEKRLGSRNLMHAGESAGGALIIGLAGSMLAILHGIEAALWGAVRTTQLRSCIHRPDWQSPPHNHRDRAAKSPCVAAQG